MDAFHQQQQGRRKTTMGGDQWYRSSSPPPPPPGSYHQHQHPQPPPHQHNYLHPPPPIPPPPQQQQQQQWVHPPENHHHHHHLQQHQQQPPMVMPPPPLPPHPLVPTYHNQPPVPPYPSHLHHQYPPPHHPMSLPHHPPPPSAYPPPNQAWGNPSWTQHRRWEYPESSIPYNNAEDWAARARAWAAAKSGTENHHTQSHFTPIGRMEEHSYAYHDRYQQAVGAPTDVQQPSLPQSSNQQLPTSMMDAQKQVNHLHGPVSYSSGSSSYGTDGHACYSAGDEAMATNAGHMASPQKSYGPSSLVYDQEVPYSYSSAPGNREAADQSEGLHPLPLPVSSVQEGYHSRSTLPVQLISEEPPHFSHRGQSTNFLPDASDQPLNFEPRPASDHEPHQNISYGHAGHTGAVGVMDHDVTAASIHAWTPSAAPGVGLPQTPLGPAGTQFDPSFIPHASLPVHPAPLFGRIPAPSFGPGMPSVSAPFGLGPGASLHHAAAFSGDANGGLNLSERPKKAAVPNWLREEIIKKKSVIPSTIPTEPTGGSFDSIGSEDADKSFRRADHADSKSIDSTRSTEDEEDDEEDVEAARSAAINQEIKRVLTEVLLKVTDELFDEIATKVLNEDELTVEVEESTILGNQKKSPPPAISTPKASAKILNPAKMEKNKVDGVGENSSASSPGGDILGLANYASDASDDDDEIRSSRLLSSRKKDSASHQHVSNDKSSESVLKVVDKGNSLLNIEASGRTHDLKGDRNGADVDGATQEHGARLSVGDHTTKNGSPACDNLYYPEKASEGVSGVSEEPIPVDSEKINEFPSGNANALQPKDTIGGKDGRRQESTSGHSNIDKLITREYWDRESKSKGTNKNPSKRGNSKDFDTEVKVRMDKTSRETSDGSASIIHEDRNKLKEKMDKRDKLKERADDKSAERGANVKESDSRRSSKHNSIKDDRKETTKDKREKNKEDSERKRERVRDEKEDRSIRATKDSFRYNSRRSPSPSDRGKNIKDNSFCHVSASGDEPSDNSKKRKQQSYDSSLSPSPTKSRKRQVSRSPHSKHSHRRHSPYPSTERRRRRSRSVTPIHRRSAAHKHDS